jgi:hypothetical protein
MVRDVPVASLSASELHEIDEDLATIEGRHTAGLLRPAAEPLRGGHTRELRSPVRAASP